MDEETDLKYLRVGYVDLGRPCDKLVQCIFSLLPGEVMPHRWQLGTKEEFIKTYGEGNKWGRTQSAHFFLHDGIPIFRMWNNQNTEYALLDITEELAIALDPIFVIEKIPEGSFTKTKPFIYRTRISTLEQVSLLQIIVRDIYGLGRK